MFHPFYVGKAPAKKGKKAKNAAAAEDAEDQENAKRKAYWVEEEERVLTQEYGRLRQLKVMCGVATWTVNLNRVLDLHSTPDMQDADTLLSCCSTCTCCLACHGPSSDATNC